MCHLNLRVERVHETNKGFVRIEVEEMRIYICYFSPSDHFDKSVWEFNSLEESIQMTKGNKLITDDFISQSPKWQESRLDKSGMLVSTFLKQYILR